MLIEELQKEYKEGKYHKVIFAILNLQSSKKIDFTNDNLNDETIELIYLKLKCLLKLKFNNDAITESNAYLTIPGLFPISKLKLIIIHLSALIEQGNLLQAVQIIHQADFYLKCISSSLSMYDEKIIAKYYHVKGTIFFYRGDLVEAITFLKKALIIRENYQETKGISDSINNMGMVYQSLGEFELAIKCYLECISLDQSLNYEMGISISLNNLGFISLQTGDLEEAYNYFIESYALVRKISKLQDEPESNKEISYKFLDLLLLNFEDHEFVGELFSNLGSTLYKKGEINGALMYYSKALYIYQKVNNVVLLSDLYIQILSINLEINKFDDAKAYLILLDKLNTSESKTIQLRNKFAHALISNNQKRFKGKFEAQKIFYEIINSETVDWNILINTMTLLSELLFEEFMFFEQPSIIDEAKAIIDKMHTIAKDKKSFSLLIETYLLKMKFAVIEDNLDKAIAYLDQAWITSIEKNLVSLQKKVTYERNKLESDYQNWKDFLKNSSMKERFEKIEIIDYMNKIKTIITPFKD